jgi:hypothetical protein
MPHFVDVRSRIALKPDVVVSLRKRIPFAVTRHLGGRSLIDPPIVGARFPTLAQEAQ